MRSISGATEEDIEIGGLEFDKAERAIFSVYAVYFEIVETFKNLLADPSEIGTTIKYLVSHAIGYRKWAKNYIEKLKETVGSVSFDEIAKDVEIKCALLINSEHSLGLSEIGVSKVMKNLLSTVAAKVKAPVLKKKNSK